MFSTISFTQGNRQQGISASGILTRTVGVKGMDMALIHEPWFRDGCISGLSFAGCTL